MRLKKDKVDIDYLKTKQFFSGRAQKYNEQNPYSVTMYQDNDEELVKKRNKYEIEKLYPFLEINAKSKILDLACGIGRWADAINGEISEYCGIDFNEELIKIAQTRNMRKNVFYYSGSADKVTDILKANGKGQFNIILMIGILVYLNDREVNLVYRQLGDLCEEHAVICVREPIGIQERLTLKDFYSEELQDDYSAIYRTRSEIISHMEVLFQEGFQIKEEGFLFDEDELNNRKETSQYFFVLER